MKTKYFILAATAITMMASCADEKFVGDENLLGAANGEGAITFGTGLKAVTRAASDKTGKDAADLLNSNFVFYGTKNATPVTVFNNYQARFAENSSQTSESNSSGWEYVSYYNVPGGVRANTGVVTFSATGDNDVATTDDNDDKIEQTIKYWDYHETQYDFAAYSLGLGAGVTPTYAKSSAINASTKSYTLTGSADELKACYVSDLVTKYNRDGVSDYGTPVQFSFRSLAAKIRLAFYETIPGYSVKDVKFYTSSDAAIATDGTESDPTLFASSAVLPSGDGTMTITFPTTGWSNKSETDYNKAHVSFAKKTDSDASSTLVLEDLANFADPDKSEAAGNYLGRTSNTATYAGGLVGTPTPTTGKYYTILPYETGANLTLRIKYTLVSTDGYGETINVDNASAVIPAEFAKWSSNYAYTYIFKIGDMTNGSTGVDGSGAIVYGLTPITLDAVVVDSEEGVQETITTVSSPSITTYAEGKVITTNDEYKKDTPIYIIVNNGTSNVALTLGTDAKLYTATIQPGAAQGITEATVENAITNGTYDSGAKTYTVTDANGKDLVVTDTESTLLSIVNQIDAEDSPTGNIVEIGTNKVAKFTPTAAGNYIFGYTKGAVAATYYTSSEAITHNAGLTGAKSNGGTLNSEDEANAYNTTLTGAVKAGDDVPADYATKVGSAAAGSTLTSEEAVAYNATLDGAKTNGDTLDSDAEANAYNSTLPGAVKEGDVKTPAEAAEKAYKVIKVVN